MPDSGLIRKLLSFGHRRRRGASVATFTLAVGAIDPFQAGKGSSFRVRCVRR